MVICYVAMENEYTHVLYKLYLGFEYRQDWHSKKGKRVPALCMPQITCYKEHPIINGGSGYSILVKRLIFFSALGLGATLSFLKTDRSLSEF